MIWNELCVLCLRPEDEHHKDMPHYFKAQTEDGDVLIQTWSTGSVSSTASHMSMTHIPTGVRVTGSDRSRLVLKDRLFGQLIDEVREFRENRHSSK